MNKPPILFSLVVAVLFGAIGGYAYSEWKNDAEELDARRMNYTDRGSTCLEAAAMIRHGNTEAALAFLEEQVLHAIRGVPMGDEYVELPERSQAFLVSGQIYDNAFPGLDLEIGQLVTDVPANHRWLPPAIESLPRTSL